MAAPESIGESNCHDCGTVVYPAKNSGGLAYYRCGKCGFEGRHHVHKSSDGYITRRVRLENIEPEKTEKKPEISEQKPEIVARKEGESLTDWMRRKNTK